LEFAPSLGLRERTNRHSTYGSIAQMGGPAALISLPAAQLEQ
jgi:hypothetical protein